ncbi:MAG: cupin domain-containing protein [Bacteroidota bacterium]
MSPLASQANIHLMDAYRKVSNLIGGRSLSLFQHGSLEIKLYTLNSPDHQTQHIQDELYIVVKGKGNFFIDGSRISFVPGDILFVPAGVEHHFEDFSGELVAWVIYYGPDGGEHPFNEEDS